MLSALPTRAALTQIMWYERPYVSDEPAKINKMVDRQSFLRSVRKLRTTEESPLQESVREVRSEAAQPDAEAEEPFYSCFVQRPITDSGTIDQSLKIKQLRNPKIPTSEDDPSPLESYIAPVLAEQLPLFLERELLCLIDDTRQEQAERVLEYLAQAESKELDPWARDDIRVAWCTVLYAARGFEKPWEYAFSCYYGKPPSKAIPIWLAKWAARDLMLGPGLTESSEIYPPKKRPTKVTSFSQDSQRSVLGKKESL